jgi:hypothetical protein
METNEIAARVAAHAAATPAREIKNAAHRLYDDALKVFRRDYNEGYKMELGNPAWTPRLEEGFIKGFVTTRGTLHLGTAGLTVAEVNAHIDTTLALTDMKRNLTQMYDHYIETCHGHMRAFDEAYELAMTENNHGLE